MDSSQQIDRLDETGLDGFGDLKLAYGSHTMVTIYPNTQHAKVEGNVSLTMHRILFEHVKLEVHGISLIITKCTFEDSSLTVNQSNMLDMSYLDWRNARNMSLLLVQDVASLKLEHSLVINNSLYFNCSKNVYFNVNGAVDIQNVTSVSMKNISLHNNHISVKQGVF